jgi:hypothetical protein
MAVERRVGRRREEWDYQPQKGSSYLGFAAQASPVRCSMDPALLILSHLHPLVGILQSARDQYQRICHNREKCLHLIRRSDNILIAIDKEIVKYGQPDSLEDAIDRLGQ